MLHIGKRAFKISSMFQIKFTIPVLMTAMPINAKSAPAIFDLEFRWWVVATLSCSPALTYVVYKFNLLTSVHVGILLM